MSDIVFDRAPRFQDFSEWFRQLSDAHRELLTPDVLGIRHDRAGVVRPSVTLGET